MKNTSICKFTLQNKKYLNADLPKGEERSCLWLVLQSCYGFYPKSALSPGHWDSEMVLQHVIVRGFFFKKNLSLFFDSPL